MLQRLTIRNYALIEELDIEFREGLSIITGETGSGKSILLGALGLLLGERADSSVLRDQKQKCILEARFDINQYQLESFFTANDLDFDSICILRRELTPQGKSRAFVNDTPVNLSQLKELGSHLVDIHSQHDSLQLKESAFLIQLLDGSAGLNQLTTLYKECFHSWKSIRRRRDELIEEERRLLQEEDFLKFQFNELQILDLKDGEEQSVEAELNSLQHAEDIREQLSLIEEVLDRDDQGVLQELRKSIQAAQSISAYSQVAVEVSERLQSVLIELKDILQTASEAASDSEIDPQKLHVLELRWDKLNHVLQKHRVSSTAELIELRDQLDERLQRSSRVSSETEDLDKQTNLLYDELNNLGQQLHEERLKIAPKLEKVCLHLLNQLGMPKAQVSFQIVKKDSPDVLGYDNVKFLFSANAGQAIQELSKVASGGEFSRLMLSLKKVLASTKALPTIIFDEIDTGVSGAIAEKMGDVFEEMGKDMQVMVITHLPQIAGKGRDHFKVVKQEEGKKTISKIVRLGDDERIAEVAAMLSGKELTEAALSHAKSLLGLTSS
ncbi:MAG: DNA repair protein RecN [Bacteroidia bacterium]